MDGVPGSFYALGDSPAALAVFCVRWPQPASDPRDYVVAVRGR